MGVSAKKATQAFFAKTVFLRNAISMGSVQRVETAFVTRRISERHVTSAQRAFAISVATVMLFMGMQHVPVILAGLVNAVKSVIRFSGAMTVSDVSMVTLLIVKHGSAPSVRRVLWDLEPRKRVEILSLTETPSVSRVRRCQHTPMFPFLTQVVKFVTNADTDSVLWRSAVWDKIRNVRAVLQT